MNQGAIHIVCMHKGGEGLSEECTFAYRGRGSCQCQSMQYDCCNVPNSTNNTIDFRKQLSLIFNMCNYSAKEND